MRKFDATNAPGIRRNPGADATLPMVSSGFEPVPFGKDRPLRCSWFASSATIHGSFGTAENKAFTSVRAFWNTPSSWRGTTGAFWSAARSPTADSVCVYGD